MAEKNYKFTNKMKTLVNDSISSIGSFYSREDVSELLAQYKRAPMDSKQFRRKACEKVCEAIGIDFNELLCDQSLLDEIPTRAKLGEELMTKFYNMCREFPRNADYMTRLVRERAPEYESDTVRLAILKKFIIGTGLECKALPTVPVENWVMDKKTEDECGAFDKLSSEEKAAVIANGLTDEIFEDIGKSREKNSDTAERVGVMLKKFDALLKKDVKDPPLDLDLPTTLSRIDGLIEKYDIKPSGGSARSKLEAVYGARGIIDGDELDGLVTAVEKEYKAQMKKIIYVDQNGREKPAVNLYTEGLRNLSNKKSSDDVCEIVRMCDDLASGKFRISGKARKEMYYFAFMFGMTAATRDGEKPNPDTDISKRLFEDYYCDNLARYLSAGYEGGKEVEKEPTGEGINYKNFVEVIYLHYLSRTEPKSPGKRIDKAEDTIKKCVDEAKRRKKDKQENGASERSDYYTWFFKDLYSTDVFGIAEKELVGHIVDNYDVLSSKNANILASGNTNMAYDHLFEIYEGNVKYNETSPFELDPVYDPDMDLDEDHKTCLNVRYNWSLADMLKDRYKNDESFCGMVDQIRDRLTKSYDFISYQRAEFLAKLLHAAYKLCGKDGRRAALSGLITEMEKNNAFSTEGGIKKAIDTLAGLGFKISEENGKVLTSMGASTEKGKTVCKCINMHLDKASRLLYEMLLDSEYKRERVTRTGLISYFADGFLARIAEYDLSGKFKSLPDLRDKFCKKLDPILIESRFQPISEKNVLDVFVIFSLYQHMLDSLENSLPSDNQQ